MSSRPVDWSAVGWDRDPTPGDPDAVAELAARFRRTAEAVETAAQGLRNIRDADSYKGEAGEELRKRTRDLADAVRGVRKRYEEAAEALDAYHPQQYAAQRMADQALRNAESAQSQQVTAANAMALYPEPLAGVPEDPQVTAYRSSAQRAGQEAVAAIERARAEVQRAHEFQNAAGNAAAAKLKDAITGKRLNDSVRDNLVGNTVGQLSTGFLKTVAKWADRIAAVAGVIALAANVIPIIGQAVAVIAGAVAGLASLASLISHAILWARGEEDWKGTAFAVVGLLTLGAGRAAKASGKVAVQATRGRVWANLRRIAPTNKQAVGVKLSHREMTTLVGGRLGEGRGALKAVTQGRRTALGAFTPRAFARDFWQGIVTTRSGSGFQAWRASVGRPWASTFQPLGRIEPSLLKMENAQALDALARNRQMLARVAGIGDQAATGVGAAQETWELVQGEKPVRVRPSALPQDEIDSERMSGEDVEGARNGALFAIGYRRHEIPRPVQGWPVPVPGLRREPVPS